MFIWQENITVTTKCYDIDIFKSFFFFKIFQDYHWNERVQNTIYKPYNIVNIITYKLNEIMYGEIWMIPTN